jgi:8-oxo-dGTP pyrophosphatase MutT (NUDIX family)
MARRPAGPRAPVLGGSAPPGLHDALGGHRHSPRGPSPECRLSALARLRNATATSAGGIVIRYEEGVPQLVVGSRRREPDGVTWTLPKGTPQAGETVQQTALREVAEETGLRVRITKPFDSIEYWFVQRGTRIHKTVHYFLMEPIGGDLAGHDHEFDQVRWLALRDAPGVLTFETERALVARALARLTATDVAAVTEHPVVAAGDPGPAQAETQRVRG